MLGGAADVRRLIRRWGQAVDVHRFAPTTIAEARSELELVDDRLLFARAERRAQTLTAFGSDEAPAPGARRDLWAARVYAGGTAIAIGEAQRSSTPITRLLEMIEAELRSPVRRTRATLLALPAGVRIEAETAGDTLLVPLRGASTLSADGRTFALDDARAYLPAAVPFALASSEPCLLLRVVVELEPAWRVVAQALASRLASRPGFSEPLTGLFDDGAVGALARERLTSISAELARELGSLSATEIAEGSARAEAATRRARAEIPRRAPPAAAGRRSFYADAEWGVRDIARRADDIHIVTYQRSGTTLTQMILFQLLGDGDLDRIGHLYEASPFPAFELRMVGTTARLDAMASPRVFKCHAPFEQVYSPEGRFIYVARDGMDVAVSAFHHHIDVGEGPIPFDVHVDQFIESADWFRDVARWWEHRERPNVLLLTYRELLTDRRGAIERIARFCGIDVDPSKLERAVERSSFEYMKANESKLDHFEGLRWLRQQRSRAGFVRAGRSGEGRRALTARERRRFAAAYARHLGHTGLGLGEDGDEQAPGLAG